MVRSETINLKYVCRGGNVSGRCVGRKKRGGELPKTMTLNHLNLNWQDSMKIHFSKLRK